MRLKEYIYLIIFFVYLEEQNTKTPILKIIKDEDSIVAWGLQRSFYRFSKNNFTLGPFCDQGQGMLAIC